MSQPDPVKVSKTLSFLLRHRPDVGHLELDDDGWARLAAVCKAASRLLRYEVGQDFILELVRTSDVQRFEVDGGRIRAARSTRKPRALTRRDLPDILYHATTESHVEGYRASGKVAVRGNRHVYLSANEGQAWRVAHRMGGGRPAVLYVDTARARRHGVRFFRNRRNGLFMSTAVPVGDVLNLVDGFADQLSAGGIPVRTGEDGRPQVALIRVTRRSGTTWEVAKGKLESGETPEHTAVREVQEEMGIEIPLRITGFVGHVRYGFLTPRGAPRLKTVFLYLMEAEHDIDEFVPATGEGIGDVKWFDIDEACRAVTHSSLIPMMHRARGMLLDEREVAAPPSPDAEQAPTDPSR